MEPPFPLGSSSPVARAALAASALTTLLYVGFSAWRFESLGAYQDELEATTSESELASPVEQAFVDVYTSPAVYVFATASLLVALAVLACLGGAVRGRDPSLLKWASIGNCGCLFSSALAVAGLVRIGSAGDLDVASTVIYALLALGFAVSFVLVRRLRQDPSFELSLSSDSVHIAVRRGKVAEEPEVMYAEPAY